MSEILGYDVNGRPLRAGDRAILLNADNYRQALGRTVTVLGPAPDGSGDVVTDIPHRVTGGYWECRPHSLRRLDDRTAHQPSEFTFDSLMDNLKQGAPDHA